MPKTISKTPTKGQLKYIRFLLENEKNGVFPNQRQIAESFQISRIAVNMMFKKLLDRGYIIQYRGKTVEIPQHIQELCKI